MVCRVELLRSGDDDDALWLVAFDECWYAQEGYRVVNPRPSTGLGDMLALLRGDNLMWAAPKLSEDVLATINSETDKADLVATLRQDVNGGVVCWVDTERMTDEDSAGWYIFGYRASLPAAHRGQEEASNE